MKGESEQSNDLHMQAGEYVLGTLQGEEREAFEKALRDDFSLQAEVDAWERRLSPMMDEVEPVDPPRHVWRSIEKRVGKGSGSERSFPDFWNSLYFWRGLGVVAATLLLTLSLYNGGVIAPAPDRMMVITDTLAQPAWVVTNHGGENLLHVAAMETRELPEGRYCELWMEGQGGEMISLGVLPHDGSKILNLPREIHATTRFKVSVESERASPVVRPGPDVIFEGSFKKI